MENLIKHIHDAIKEMHSINWGYDEIFYENLIDSFQDTKDVLEYMFEHKCESHIAIEYTKNKTSEILLRIFEGLNKETIKNNPFDRAKKLNKKQLEEKVKEFNLESNNNMEKAKKIKRKEDYKTFEEEINSIDNIKPVIKNDNIKKENVKDK